jgi:tetratricopeptide (TPR) repeat protein
MIVRVIKAVLIVSMLGGCAAQYGPKGINGGYSDKKINQTTYFIRYDGASLAGALASEEGLSTLWNRRAKELCGGEDFYKDTRTIRIDGYGNESSMGTPAMYGMVYCNNKFIDTRSQNPDENFTQYINLPYDVFEYKEITPLWNLLIDDKYQELQNVIDDLIIQLNESEISGILNTFSRINPVAEKHLTQWIDSEPDSFIALYSRSLFYHHYSWFKRGSRLWKDVTEEQRAGLKKYRDLAVSDLDKTLSLNPKFCPAHALKLQIYTSIKSAKGAAFEEIYRAAESECPESMAVREAYLRYLLPRWSGSNEKMANFINKSKNDSELFKALEALYLAEEGDQYLFKDKFDQALEKYNKALVIGRFSQIYTNRALVLENLSRFVDSVKDLEDAINLTPYNDTAYERLTRVLLKQNNYVGALIASSYLTTMNNQSPKNFEIKGNIFYSMRRYEDALVSYKKAAILSSDEAVYLHKVKMAEYQISVRKDSEMSERNGQAI